MNFFSSNKKDQKKGIPSNAEDIIRKLKRNKYYEYCFNKCILNPMSQMFEGEQICMMQCSDSVHNYLASTYTELIALKSKF